MTTRLTSGMPRKTDDGWVVTSGTLKTVGALFTLLIALATYGAKAFATSERIDNAVQQDEFRDTTRAIRGDVRDLAAELGKTSRATLAIQCQQARYPAGFCDDVPRAIQAGAPRDGTTTRRQR